MYFREFFFYFFIFNTFNIFKNFYFYFFTYNNNNFFNVNLKKIKEQPKKINTIEAIFKIILKIKKIISKQN